MFLHIGDNIMLNTSHIIAMMDLDNTTNSKISREFLTTAEEEGFIVSVSQNIPKTFIIAEVDKKSRIYLSPISTSTLKKRIAKIIKR